MTKAFRRRWLVAGISIALATGIGAQVVRQSERQPGVEEELGVTIEARDGIHLAADVFRPAAFGRWPTVLVRTPYNRKNSSNRSYERLASRGYSVVIEDTRGRFASQGTPASLQQEGADANDTIDWIAAQPWSNGRVGMVGASYLGIVQWWAAIQDNPHLVTIAPVNSGDDEYLDRFYSPGGALKLGHRLLWLAENFTPPSRVRPQFGSYIFHLPTRSSDLAATGTVLPIWRNALAHPSYDAYWHSLSIRDKLKRVDVPVLSMSGWFDNYAESELNAFTTLSKEGDTVETWIGPWSHIAENPFPTVKFGPESVIHIRAKQADWLDKWLKYPPAEGERAQPSATLHLFVMGPNVWREEHEWPLRRTRWTPLFLDSGGHANSVAGDGSLTWQTPGRKTPSDTFTYDPKTPVPTIGGAICCNPRVLPPGPLDESPVENRRDVLVYTSPALTEELETTGPVKVVLYISTSVNDTDFTAKLVDVQPDGRPLLVCDGLQRLRYRMSLSKPVFVKKNTRYQITVDAGVTSYVFEPGHRIRLEVSSSNFPRFDRNLNSVRPVADETKITKAKQTVYHQTAYASAIILPVIPRPLLRTAGTHAASRARW